MGQNNENIDSYEDLNAKMELHFMYCLRRESSEAIKEKQDTSQTSWKACKTDVIMASLPCTKEFMRNFKNVSRFLRFFAQADKLTVK